MKLKSFCTAKKTTNKMKDNQKNGRKYLQMMQLKLGISKIDKQLT